MQYDMHVLMRLIAKSLMDPVEAAKTVYGYQIDRTSLWSLLLLVTVVSVLLIALGNLLTGIPEEFAESAVQITPFAFALILGASLVILVFALYFVGQSLGGTGTFPDTLLCVIWFQVLSIAIQIVQLFALIVIPPLSNVVTLVGMGVLLFALVHFINALHGFESIWKSIGALILSMIGIAFGFSFILAVVGVSAAGVG